MRLEASVLALVNSIVISFSFFHMKCFIFSLSCSSLIKMSTVSFINVDILPFGGWSFGEREIEELGRGESQQWKFQG